MKPILYSKDETQFVSNGIGVLYDALECTVEEERNGMFECSMVYPIGGQWFSEIKLDRILLVKASLDPSRKWQPFRIYKISKPLTGKVTAYARHISYQLNDILVNGFEAASVPDTFAKFKSELLDPDSCPFTFWTNHSSSASDTGYSYDFVAPIRSRLGGTEGSVLDIWHGEYEWDGWTVKFYDSMGLDTGRGKDRGVVFRYGKDISDMTQESDIGELVTRIYPYFRQQEQVETGGDDGSELTDGEERATTYETVDHLVVLDEKYVSISDDQMNRYGFAYHRTAMVDMTSNFEYDRDNPPTDDEIKQGLKEMAQAMLAFQGVVNENNQITIIPPDDVVELCDVVGIENDILGISVSTKIKKVTFDALGEKYTSLEIGDLKTDFTESIKSEMAATTNAAVTDAQNSIEADIVRANTVIADRINANRADIKVLFAEKATIKELDAEKARITDLEATRASIQDLRAVNADIANLRANKAEIADLRAANASITNLNADYANIKSLLAGNAAVGDLTSIHLTSINSDIDTALVNDIIANYATLNNLVAGRISSGEVETSGIKIVGNVIQVVEDDGQGGEVVKMQMGEDSKGNFTFVIFGENNNVLLDENGLHTEGVPDGLVVDRMVKAADGSYLGLSANKLNIDNVSESVVNNINSSSRTINSDKIFFEQEKHTLTQMYSEMSSGISTANSNAKAALDGLEQAMDAIAGVDRLTPVVASLTNDAHVVHTLTDGTGGDYTSCNSSLRVYLGETDVTNTSACSNFTQTASTGITGTWNANTKTYQVTNMSVDSGYVDLSVDYTTSDEEPKTLTFTKRFSISKVRDGQVGYSFFLTVDPERIYRKKDGTFSNDTVTLTGSVVNNSTSAAYNGFFTYQMLDSSGKVLYSADSTNAASSFTTASLTSYPTTTLIKAWLKSATDKSVLDISTIYVIPDIEEIQADVGVNTNAVSTINSTMTNIQTGLKGLRVDLGNTQTTVNGVKNSLDKTLLYSITHRNKTDETTTCYAHVWKECKEVTKQYPEKWFTWYRKTENGEVYLGEGYEITVNNADFEWTGVVIGRFTTYEDNKLLGNNSTKAIAFGDKIVSFSAVEL